MNDRSVLPDSSKSCENCMLPNNSQTTGTGCSLPPAGLSAKEAERCSPALLDVTQHTEAAGLSVWRL
jgi:hypothetical protein